jgi:hypothetical protein
MKRDVLVISGGMLAVGVVVWAVWGNPENAPRTHIFREMQAAPELKLVSERSPYMRSER